MSKESIIVSPNLSELSKESFFLGDGQLGTSLPLASSQVTAQVSQADRDRLIMEHMSTVKIIARRMHERLPKHVELEELVSAGVIGLIDAVQKFNFGKHIQFKSYAQFRIRGAILDSLREVDWSPRELRRKGRAIEEVIRTSTAALGRAPSDEEIASELDLALDEYQQLLGELKGLEIGSLNLARNEDSGEEELSYIPGPSTDDPLFRCLEGEMRDRLTAAIDNLPERERLVLTLYYYEELTMREIAVTLGVVESRISQIRTSAVLRLRGALVAEDKLRPAPKVKSCGSRRSRSQEN